MSYVSTPQAPNGERWFRESATEQNPDGGVWHLGRVHARQTWPIRGTAFCGEEPGVIAVGLHETALCVGVANSRLVCDTCLRLSYLPQKYHQVFLDQLGAT